MTDDDPVEAIASRPEPGSERSLRSATPSRLAAPRLRPSPVGTATTREAAAGHVNPLQVLGVKPMAPGAAPP